MTKIFGANWRTSVTAIGTAIFAALTWLSTVSYDTSPLALVIDPKYKPTVQWVAGIATLALWIWNGVSQKDKTVTGGSVQQTLHGDVAKEGTQTLVDITKDSTPPK